MKLKDFFKFTHIGNSPLTTIAGLAILSVSVYTIYKKQAVGIEDITLMTLALGLLGAKDPNQVKPGSGAAMLAVVCVLASGCVTNKKCIDKFGSTTNTITIHDTVNTRIEVPVPGDHLESEISDDSLKMLLTGVIDSMNAVSDSKNLSIKFWKDKYTGAIKYSANMKKDTVVVFKDVIVEVKGDCPPVVVASPPVLSWYEKLWNWFQFFSAFIVLGGLCLVICVIVFKRL